MGHGHLKGHLHKLQLVGNHTYNRCLECNETALHMLWYCEAFGNSGTITAGLSF